ncbi:hypothetical protein N3K66_007118 [Trichothecium roseum]|uniref:Uncharacterized protein n=1 Tax=Trichothecium roseum TaxID=47278 RepID=A0ACC0UZV1_9HYPO|nr:hypothetical protein N3K66_007118 [Trichothecium roseum]
MDTGADIFASHIDFHNDGFFNIDADPSMAVDPQLSLSYYDADDKTSNATVDPFIVAPSIWDDPLDNSLSYFTNFERDSVIKEEHGRRDGSENPDAATTASSASRATSQAPTSKASQASIKSAATSPASTAPAPAQPAAAPPKGKKRTRNGATKKPEKPTDPQPQKDTTPNKESDQDQLPETGGEESSVKRTKFLERNRIAASKCRQKKKEWVHELEETKTELEAQHVHLHREYNSLLEEVSNMKNQLMAHAGCNDANIDQWIDLEARRFVQKTTDQSPGTRRKSSAGSIGSFFSQPSIQDPMMQMSPLADAAPLLLSPPLKQEDNSINYDHMPDELFQ